MQTYQRLIKKERLKAIREFVNQGGYFPNSLIVSINSDKGVKFDLGSPKVEGVNSKIGILHLPQNYQSVYVIDGQHRLYGYSETKWADKNSIPVVAFVNLPGEEQVKMFMDINQNQKPVSKALRNTLNIDLLWDSPLFYQRNEALMLHIGQSLGEDPSSPLYGRVVIGEDTQSGKRCITLEYIKEAIKQSNFLSTYKRKSNEELTVGPFSKENNDKTFDLLYAFLKKGFQYVKDNCRTEWDKGQEGFLTINNCTYALIRVFGDIADIVLSKNGGTVKVSDADSFYDECKPLLDSLSRTLNTLDAESINAIKNSKGGGAKKVSWRSLQVALHNADPSFTNEELEQYIKEKGLTYTFLRDNFYMDFFVTLAQEYGEIKGPAGNGKVSAVVRSDVAKVAVAILKDSDKWANQTLDMTGPEALTLSEMAEQLSHLLGKTISYVEETVEEAYASRKAWPAED